MTNVKREFCRRVLKFLKPEVAKKGNEEFGNEKFSFRNLVTVERDDSIRAENKKSMTELAKDVKMSRNHMYTVRRRK